MKIKTNLSVRMSTGAVLGLPALAIGAEISEKTKDYIPGDAAYVAALMNGEIKADNADDGKYRRVSLSCEGTVPVVLQAQSEKDREFLDRFCSAPLIAEKAKAGCGVIIRPDPSRLNDKKNVNKYEGLSVDDLLDACARKNIAVSSMALKSDLVRVLNLAETDKEAAQLVASGLKPVQKSKSRVEKKQHNVTGGECETKCFNDTE